MKTITLIKKLPLISTVLILGGITLFSFSGYFWYTSVYSNPRNMLKDGLANALRTSGVTYTTVTSQADVNLTNISNIRLAGNFSSQVISQATNKSDNSKAETEVVSVDDQQYLRYRQLQTGKYKIPQKSYENVWTKLAGAQTGSNLTPFARGVTAAPVPIANFGNTKHQQIMVEMAKHDVFAYDHLVKNDKFVNGQKTAVIHLRIDTGYYAQFMREFLKMQGLKADSNIYPGDDNSVGQKVSMELAITYSGHQIVQAAWGELRDSYATTFTGWGVSKPFEAPAKTIDFVELQRRIFSGSN